MYVILLSLHSICRWLVVISLLYAIFRGIRGWSGRHLFSSHDNTVRHVTATIAHIQLALGYILYFTSPVISYFRAHYHEALLEPSMRFFGLIHISLMTLAIVLITIGSSAAKRQLDDKAQFRTMTLWFLAGAFIIFIAIPWPFSPLASRPILRLF